MTKRFRRFAIRKHGNREELTAYGQSDRGSRVVLGTRRYTTAGLTTLEKIDVRRTALKEILDPS